MKEITIQFDDASYTRAINAFSALGNRPEQVTVNGQLVDNPVSKEEFMENCFCSHGQEVISAYESRIAAEVARIAAIEKAKSEVVITPKAKQ